MEERLEPAGQAPPHGVTMACLKELPGQAALQNGKQQLEDGLPQEWATQCQEFLKALDSHRLGWGSPPRSKLGPWDDAKAFLASFEQVAEACQWPREDWAARLLPALSGEAQQAFSGLEAAEREDYRKVKAAILRGEASRMEALRQHFRQFRYQEVEDPRRVYGQLQELCHQWLKPERRSKEQILELLILEQFLAILPQEMQSRVRAWDPDTSTQMAAEEFLMSPQEAKAWKWQMPAEEVPTNPSGAKGAPQRQICIEADEKAEKDLCLLASGIMSPSHPSPVLPPEEQEIVNTELSEVCEVLEWEISFDQRATFPSGQLSRSHTAVGPETKVNGVTSVNFTIWRVGLYLYVHTCLCACARTHTPHTVFHPGKQEFKGTFQETKNT
uniref:SCAN box domain-containing protein n=1 Tax=Podarcis muralis TaxID=64176 RepID=A0A670HNK5_PODMU